MLDITKSSFYHLNKLCRYDVCVHHELSEWNLMDKN